MWWYMPLFPALRRKRQMDLHEFKVILVVADRFSIAGIKQTRKKQESERRAVIAVLKRNGPHPSGLVSQRLMAEGAEGASTAPATINNLGRKGFILLTLPHHSPSSEN